MADPYIESPPAVQDENHLQQWLQRVSDQHNALVQTGTGGGTLSAGLQVNANNEVVDTNNPTERVGWFERFLHVRLTSDNAGQTLVDPTTYTGSTLFVHVFNSDSMATPGADANYIIANQLTWSGTSQIYFVPFGLNNVRFEVADTTPTGRTRISTSTTTIDLEAGVGVGATGDPGPEGPGAILVLVDQSNGNVFRNQAGMTTLRADVHIGGELQPSASHNAYDYKWTYQGNTVCVTANREVVNSNGLPLTTTTTTCTVGFPADSTIGTNPSTLGRNLREIIVGADDVTGTVNLEIDVSNIPD